MKREIKFRAWDKKEKVMIYPDEKNAEYWRSLAILPHCDGWSLCGGILWEKNDAKNYELMQYVGLKDKNKKEIYEGDIISSDSWIGEVKFIDEKGFGGYFCEQGNNPISRVGLFSMDNIDVIGNIYENKNLL